MPMTPRSWVVPIVSLGLLLGACSAAPAPQLPDASAMADAVVAALAKGDISGLPFAGSPDDAVKEYGIVTAGLGGLKPAVRVTDISYQPDVQSAVVRLDQVYNLAKPWNFPSLVNLHYAGSDGWQVVWSPTIVQPALDGYTRLTMTKKAPTRGSILGSDGSPIVYNRPVENVGIDKSQVSADQALISAKALAKLVGVNVDNYVTRVKNGGSRQFVIAITLRQGRVPDGVDAIPGSLIQDGTLPLGPSSTFASGLLGIASAVTAEDIQKSNGKLSEGDIIGKTGVQASQDAILRGTDGYTIYLAPRSDADVMAPPPADDQTPSPSASSTPITQRQALFQVDPVDGGDVQITLNVGLQTKAEKVLSGQKGVAALVVLDVQTGAIMAAANSPSSGANPYATTGKYAPGSSFKISTALALLRSGMTTDSKIDCPTSVTVQGMKFTNVSDYASSHNGSITLRQAVAWSCNTAMVNGSLKLGNDDIANAAASLGIGVGYDLGFPNFLGAVPVPTAGVDKAASAFGQGAVLASPLAMAAEAASVASGKTIVPYLLIDQDTGEPVQTPSDSAASVTPLTSQEAASLRDMMAAVVSIGTGTGLRGYVQGAKTGTAEFTEDGTTKTHAWMIAYTDKYAIAAYVHVGSTGAVSAGPLIKAFLTS